MTDERELIAQLHRERAETPAWATPTYVPPWDERPEHMPVVLVASDGTRPDPRRLQADLLDAWRAAGRPVVVAVSVFGVPPDTADTVRRWVGLHAFAGIRHRTVATRPAGIVRVLAYGRQLTYPAAGWAREAA